MTSLHEQPEGIQMLIEGLKSRTHSIHRYMSGSEFLPWG